jgi:hypothetical protein
MIDDIGRTAVDDLRRSVTEDLFPDDMLRRLHETRRRRSLAGVSAVGLVTVVLAVGTYVSGAFGLGPMAAPPAGRGTPTDAPRSEVRLPPEVCAEPRISCLGDRRVLVGLRVPVEVDVPESFVGRMLLTGASMVEDYRTDVDKVGITIVEGARAVTYDDTWETDPSAGTDGPSVARWLADRPFFSDAVTTRITVSGLPAWRVTPTMRRGAELPVSKGIPAAPTFAGNGSAMGSGPDLDGEYVILDVPGAGLTVIWTWSTQQGPDVLAESRRYVDALRFVTD